MDIEPYKNSYSWGILGGESALVLIKQNKFNLLARMP